MKKRKRTLGYRLLVGALCILGFSSCRDDDGNVVEYLPNEYGTPYAKFKVIGTVFSEDEQPLQGIQVIVSSKREYFDVDTTYTNENGGFETKVLDETAYFRDYYKAYFNDVDGDENGGTFQPDSIALTDMDEQKVEEGSGWYFGEYEFSSSVKLSKEEPESEE